MFCRIYTSKYQTGQFELLNFISSFFKSNTVNDRYVEFNGYSITVRLNKEFDAEKMLSFPDGFLFFPLCIEIDIDERYEKAAAAQEIAPLLKQLWEDGFSAIASCSFESLLPENGGYKHKNIPWPNRHG